MSRTRVSSLYLKRTEMVDLDLYKYALLVLAQLNSLSHKLKSTPVANSNLLHFQIW